MPEATGAGRPRPVDPRLARLPAVRLSLAVSVGLGLVSTAGVLVQAVGLARLLAGAMPGGGAGGRGTALVLLVAGFAGRALVALVGEVAAGVGASAAKAELRSRLVSAALERSTGGGPAGPGGPPERALPGPGALAALAGPGLDALDVYIGRYLPDMVLAAAAPLALVVAVGIVDWPSALVLVVVLALFPVFGALVGRAGLSLGRERLQRVEELGNYVADLFQGMPVLRAFGRSRAQRQRLAALNDALGRSTTGALRVAFLSALVLDELASLSVALVAVPLGLRLVSGWHGLAAALAVLVVAPEVFAPLRRASAEFHESTTGLAAWARVLEVAAPLPGGPLPGGPVPGGPVPGGPVPGAPLPGGPVPGTEQGRVEGLGVPGPAAAAVSLCSVGVSFPGRPAPVLVGADLVVAPGETVALVGPSGAGKSTVISLLAGALAPSAGTVMVGGADLAGLDLRQWRRLVAWLPEHPSMLSMSLAANLRLARPEAGDDELLEALARVGADQVVARLPLGLATPLGEGGQVLSAGELQRVALARVALRPAQLYLLDEPTVHLDRAGEERALAGLRRAMAGSSALVVTHSRAVAAAADRVVTLVDGRLVAPSSDTRHALVRA